MSVRGAGSEGVRGAGSLDPAKTEGVRGAASSNPSKEGRGAGSSDPAKNERRILLVDDEPGLRRTLSDRLRKEGYGVDTAATGDVALDLARKGHYDLIILDLNLPAKDGLQVCHELRREGQNVAVLMLTARDTTADKITGLKSGADDYMTKPFESAELLARIEALLRRTRADAVPDELTFGDVVVRPRAGQVLRGGRRKWPSQARSAERSACAENPPMVNTFARTGYSSPKCRTVSSPSTMRRPSVPAAWKPTKMIAHSGRAML